MASRTRRVIWTHQARAGLDDALAYIARDSPLAASSVLAVVLETAGSLSSLSRRGRVVPELGDEDVREVFVFSYRLLYRVTSDIVLILGFVHGSRDFDHWRSKT